MRFLQLYEDPECKRHFADLPFMPCEFSNNIGAPYTLTVGQKSYKAYGQVTSGGTTTLTITSLTGADNPPFNSYKNRFPGGKWFYTKSGFRFPITETITQGDYCRIGDAYVGTTYVCAGGQAMVSGETPLGLWLVEFTYNNTLYYGILGWAGVPASGSTWLNFAAESDFWTDTIRPDYDYGSGTEPGGNGSGGITHTDIPLSTTPAKVVPFGGRGLHAYRINAAAYASIQGFLWGESSTLAKSLWLKFQNKTHTPVSCIVGCYSLPADFMPDTSVSNGVQLAGLNLSPISGTCHDVSSAIGFVDRTYTFAGVLPPFDSWLDYTGLRCIMHIPFCGEIEISAEYVLNKDISIRYRVDQLNGNLTAIIYSDGRVIAELSGNCAYNIPVSGGDSGTLERLGAVLTGTIQLAAGNPVGALGSAAEAAAANFETHLVNSDMRGSTTSCANRVPYIEWIYPTTAYTPQYRNANGLPCEFSGTLSEFSGGYGEFEVMKKDDEFFIPNATDGEKEEIEELLKRGVIV